MRSRSSSRARRRWRCSASTAPTGCARCAGKELQLIWASWSDFWHMGGYGLYVWGSYAVCLAAMLVEPWLARRHRRRALEARGLEPR
ncbi:MAG: heme exporter protein CcmD [Burkholderiaceae bacterium]